MQQPRSYRCQVVREDLLEVVPQEDKTVGFFAVERTQEYRPDGIYLTPRAVRNLIQFLEPLAEPATPIMDDWFDGAAGR